MGACGFSATPADSYGLNQQRADYVASHPGGRGAVREVCDFILAAQGKFDAALARYLPIPSTDEK
jgi:3-deoxy-D-manno-octulosonate 8-phosphate phosphatase (KDO 8-P phosphatase)